ncbi:MAG TPA: elongation factor P [Planctomycetaceae bacterium]|nr:elongation factor P [Planctomycetaceae bacterium]HIQ21013.1 elongation factor P [Planctomycetota bacterium]
MLAKEIKRGSVVTYEDAPCLIESVRAQTPSARGSNTLYKFRARNLITKQKVDITLRGSDSLEEADFQRRPVSFMYADSTYFYFLDQTDYNQYALAKEDVAQEAGYLTEQTEGIMALIHHDQCVGIQLPVTVELAISQCDPGVRGDSATARTKPATLETGLVVQVPEYLSPGDRIKVDTRSGQFISRAAGS